MPDIVDGVVVRRIHIYTASITDRARVVACPDCGHVLMEPSSPITGAFRVRCPGRVCRDGVGEDKVWLVVFHDKIDSYMQAIKLESRAPDISDIIDRP